jgi:cysteinyl-tRNA synthetase
MLRSLAGVLGLTLKETAATAGAEPFIDLLVNLRNKLRAQKEFALADDIREDLARLGVVLEDEGAGTRWRLE